MNIFTKFQMLKTAKLQNLNLVLTHIQGCLRASVAVILLAGLTVNILLIRFLASGVTVSHSGDGYCPNDIHVFAW